MSQRGDGANETPSTPTVSNTEFLEELRKGAAPGDSLWLAHFIGDPEHAQGNWAGRAYGADDHARREADDPGWHRQNTYFAVSSVRKDGDGRLARRLGNLGRPLALVIDDPDDSKLNGTPSWVLETSPNNYQIGVFIDIEDDEIPIFNALVRRMSKAGMMGHDTSGNNAVRYVRLPMGMNLKPRDSGPFKTVMRVWNPGQRLGLADAAMVFGVDLDVVIKEMITNTLTDDSGITYSADRPGDAGVDAEGRELALAAMARDILTGNSLHDPTMRLAASLVASGMAGGAAVNLIRGLMDASMAPRDDRWTERWKDVPRLVRQAQEKFPFSPRDREPRERPKVQALSAAAMGLPKVSELTDLTVGLGLKVTARPPAWVEPSTPAGVDGAPVGVIPESEPRVATEENPGSGVQNPGVVTAAWVAPATVVAAEPVVYLKSLGEMAKSRSRVDWLVAGYLEANCLSMMYGPSGGGKSFVALSLGLAVARGTPWYGHKVKQGMVIYVCGEGFEGLDRRAQAYIKHNKMTAEEADAVPFYRTMKRVDISDHESVAELAEVVAETQRLKGGGPVGMVQIDTFNRNMSGDENTQKDVTLFFTNVIEMIQMRFKCHVMVVHHSGHGMDRARGSSVMRATVDQEFYVRPEGKGSLSFACKKMKDADEPPTLMFDITSVTLIEETQFEAGDTSAVLEPHGDPLDAVIHTTKDKKQITKRDIIAIAPRTRNEPIKDLCVLLSVANSTFGRLLQLLADEGLLVKKTDTGKTRDTYYEVSEIGVMKATRDGHDVTVGGKKVQGKNPPPVSASADEDDDLSDEAGEAGEEL